MSSEDLLGKTGGHRQRIVVSGRMIVGSDERLAPVAERYRAAPLLRGPYRNRIMVRRRAPMIERPG